jgi:hypothetical protein
MALINAGCWCLECRGNLQSCPGICFYRWLVLNQRQVDPVDLFHRVVIAAGIWQAGKCVSGQIGDVRTDWNIQTDCAVSRAGVDRDRVGRRSARNARNECAAERTCLGQGEVSRVHASHGFSQRDGEVDAGRAGGICVRAGDGLNRRRGGVNEFIGTEVVPPALRTRDAARVESVDWRAGADNIITRVNGRCARIDGKVLVEAILAEQRIRRVSEVDAILAANRRL